MRPITDDTARPDPAPSRLSYRVQRWMLTPGIRLLLRVGLPFALIFGAVSGHLADQDRRDAFNMALVDIRNSIQQRPEFMVDLMAVDGAGPSVASDIREIVPIDFPVSSFDLDLQEIRETITGLYPVKEASVRIRPGGILQIDIVERVPTLVWRTREAIELLDETGAHVGFLDARGERPDLPLIAGDGADGHVAEAMALYAASAPLGARMRGLVRVGERRWDVVLDRDQRIQLPERHPVRALERVIALSEADDMLERDVVVIDMRLGERPTLRMSDEAVKDWWAIRQINGIGQ
ncbi:cell division protein FtsQ/DivIB [Aestuariivita sp.]|jgi:cell division protein FtsQ|uniref:cell division protein FtsQ/DivIB n=1 Tax=Aestuariivita sp. TaxID=1872407 RepID=UPI0021706D52|nr:cell division protein FtsQ/DivIB [Aestuariivita sp.]MCE8008912.1 FtsQ-type POTRA domain-containing protein [Aestuariivita sp.]